MFDWLTDMCLSIILTAFDYLLSDSKLIGSMFSIYLSLELRWNIVNWTGTLSVYKNGMGCRNLKKKMCKRHLLGLIQYFQGWINPLVCLPWPVK